jgi:hypothetical protein
MAAVKYLQRGQLLPPLAYVKHTPATSGGGRAPSGIVYIGGYMSNMDGLKAKRLEALARDRDLSFVRRVGSDYFPVNCESVNSWIL